MSRIYLAQILSCVDDGTWVQIRVKGCDTIFFGRTGWQGTDDLLHLVYKKGTAYPEVYEITHLEGFDKGLSIKCR